MNANPPLALELDRSLAAFDYPGLTRVDLSRWQETVRFGCAGRDWRAFSAHLESLLSLLPAAHGVALTGSGDFHHVSAHLVARQRRHAGLRVLVCDNHPDNMRFPFGIHCGSWVAHVARMPHVARVDVVGICSADVEIAHAWENHLGLLARGRVRYWTIGAKVGWTRALGKNAARNFDDAESLVHALLAEISGEQAPLYLSIDKDVLCESEARTRWDQGRMRLSDLLRVVDAVAPRAVGGDITGEVSDYRYRTRWKRWLSALDGQSSGIARDDLSRWQRRQNEVNAILLDAFSRAGGSGDSENLGDSERGSGG